MTHILALVLGLAVVVGISLGMLGGGGSILTVPLLVYIAGLDAKAAIAASLFVVGVTSVAGMLSHARHGRVKWRTGLIFGLAGMVGAYSAGLVGGHLPGNILLIAFAIMMVATSLAMLRGRRTAPAHQSADGELPVKQIVLDGLVVGVATGLVGAGGGFLVVPALVLLGGLPMSVAVGTSLLVIAMKSFAGLTGYLSSVQLPWGLVLGVTAAAVVGSVIGGRLAGKVPEAQLRKAFGWFVLVMGGFVLVQQGPSWAAPLALATLATASLAAGVRWSFVRACPLRRAVTG
jgi:uncharacterized protein